MKHRIRIVIGLLLLVSLIFSFGCHTKEAPSSSTASQAASTLKNTASQPTDAAPTDDGKTTTPSVTEPHKHSYTQKTTAATCKQNGSVTYTCNCGNSYQTVIPATYAHDFKTDRVTSNGLSFDAEVCSHCGLIALAHGNADGSLSGGNSKVKYYVTGIVGGNFEIVVYGNGAMPNFSKTDLPMWNEYLQDARKITVADGITTIGSYAFFCPDNSHSVQVTMADSVKTIKAHGLNLKLAALTLGAGVERLEDFAIGKTPSIYWPKVLRYVADSSFGSIPIYYEGTADQFYAISLHTGTKTETVKAYLERIKAENDWMLSSFSFYVNAKNITDTKNPLKLA